MKSQDILLTRLANQQILNKRFNNVKDAVGWMGAMQAQDLPMAKWAAGLRVSGAAESQVNRAIDNAEIIRTHLLRPTWHLVSSDDIYWMLELSAPQINNLVKFRHNQLKLTGRVLKKSIDIIAGALSKTDYMTRDEIVTLLKRNKISVDENRASHILMSAESAGVICSGKIKNNRQTYALLEKRVKRIKSISREEALKKLAIKYFQSHAPASAADFGWWSGLPVKDVRTATEFIRSEYYSEKVNSIEYFFSNNSLPVTKMSGAYLLPAYDEYIISYKDRSILIPSELQKTIISINGIFRPVVIINGKVSGVWKRKVIRNKIFIEVNLFKPPSGTIRALINEAAEKYGMYSGKEVDISFH